MNKIWSRNFLFAIAFLLLLFFSGGSVLFHCFSSAVRSTTGSGPASLPAFRKKKDAPSVERASVNARYHLTSYTGLPVYLFTR